MRIILCLVGLLLTTAANAQPTSTLTRPSDTAAYAQDDLIASSVTAGSVVVPSVVIDTPNYKIGQLRLDTDNAAWAGASLIVHLWSLPPTYANGDNGPYAAVGGTAIGSCALSLSADAGGAYGTCEPFTGKAPRQGGTLYWDLQDATATALTPASGQTFSLTVGVIRLPHRGERN